MARYTAIAAVSATLEKILETEAEAQGISNTIDLLDVAAFQEDPPKADGLSLFLYRVRQSQVQRNRKMPPNSTGKAYHPPLPLDLHYLLTAWNTTSVFTQHQLLGWGMRTLANYSTLTASLLNHFSVGEDDTFRDDESLELTFESLSLDDMNTITEPLRPRINPSVSYVVRVVYLDSLTERVVAPDVQTRLLELGTMTDDSS